MEKTGKDRLFDSACYLVPFVSLGGYLLALILKGEITSAAGYYLIHYLYAYDHGFVARGLVGEVISWFYENVTDEITRNIVILFSFLLMLSASLCIGKALTKVKNNPTLFLITAALSVLLCILPASFRHYYIDIKLDKLLWALTLFAVLFVDRKYGIWLVPVFCIIATLVNPVFLFCSMILIAIILLQKFYDEKFAVKNGIVCAVSYITMIVLGIYALASEKYLGFETPNEMVDYYFSRYAGVLEEGVYDAFVTEWLYDYFEPMKKIISMSFEYYFIRWGNWIVCLLDLIILMIPTYTITVLFWKKCMSAADNRFQKFIFFLCLISPAVIILPIIFSWETSKYFYSNLMVQLSLMIYFTVTENSAVVSCIKSCINWVKNHIIVSACAVMYFASIIVTK